MVGFTRVKRARICGARASSGHHGDGVKQAWTDGGRGESVFFTLGVVSRSGPEPCSP